MRHVCRERANNLHRSQPVAAGQLNRRGEVGVAEEALTHGGGQNVYAERSGEAQISVSENSETLELPPDSPGSRLSPTTALVRQAARD